MTFTVKRISPEFYNDIIDETTGNVQCNESGMWLHGEWVKNPGFGKPLEPLYMGWAIEHLVTLNKAIMMITSHSNLNMLDAQCALMAEKKKLILENHNYWEAETILQKIGLQLGARIVQDGDE